MEWENCSLTTASKTRNFYGILHRQVANKASVVTWFCALRQVYPMSTLASNQAHRHNNASTLVTLAPSVKQSRAPSSCVNRPPPRWLPKSFFFGRRPGVLTRNSCKSMLSNAFLESKASINKQIPDSSACCWDRHALNNTSAVPLPGPSWTVACFIVQNL